MCVCETTNYGASLAARRLTSSLPSPLLLPVHWFSSCCWYSYYYYWMLAPVAAATSEPRSAPHIHTLLTRSPDSTCHLPPRPEARDYFEQHTGTLYERSRLVPGEHCHFSPRVLLPQSDTAVSCGPPAHGAQQQ